MSDIYCFSFVEDEPSAEVLRRLVKSHNDAARTPCIFFRDGFPRVLGGFGQIKRRVLNFVQMARSDLPVLVLTDLDRTDCAPTLIRDWFRIAPDSQIKSPRLLTFRIAVREVEAWLMADRKSLARYLHIPLANFPRSPDDLPDPKQELLNIVRRKGRKSLRDDMLPAGTAHIGPRYNRRLCEYIADHWVPEVAAANSPSLLRTIESLGRF